MAAGKPHRWARGRQRRQRAPPGHPGRRRRPARSPGSASARRSPRLPWTARLTCSARCPPACTRIYLHRCPGHYGCTRAWQVRGEQVVYIKMPAAALSLQPAARAAAPDRPPEEVFEPRRELHCCLLASERTLLWKCAVFCASYAALLEACRLVRARLSSWVKRRKRAVRRDQAASVCHGSIAS